MTVMETDRSLLLRAQEGGFSYVKTEMTGPEQARLLEIVEKRYAEIVKTNGVAAIGLAFWLDALKLELGITSPEEICDDPVVK